jgi:hypothetical protein
MTGPHTSNADPVPWRPRSVTTAGRHGICGPPPAAIECGPQVANGGHDGRLGHAATAARVNRKTGTGSRRPEPEGHGPEPEEAGDRTGGRRPKPEGHGLNRRRPETGARSQESGARDRRRRPERGGDRNQGSRRPEPEEAGSGGPGGRTGGRTTGNGSWGN